MRHAEWLPIVACWLLVIPQSPGAPGSNGTTGGAQSLRDHPPSTSRPNYDPHALQLLQKMADTYAHLPALEQRTEFYSELIPLQAQPAPRSPESATEGGKGTASPSIQSPNSGSAPAAPPAGAAEGQPAPGDPNGDTKEDAALGTKLDRTLRLRAARPNHLRLELRESNPNTGKETLSVWDSDGKTFWTYTEEKHWYTQEPAPSQFKDFLRLQHLDTGSLELLMLLGVNPFAEVRNEVESVHDDGTEIVRGVPTEVVTLRATQTGGSTEAHLYIGKADNLLHRLVTETTPITAPVVTGRVGDEMDMLVDHTSPPPRPVTPPSEFVTSEKEAADPDPEPMNLSGPVKTRMSYDNIIVAGGKSNAADYIFTVAEGALKYEPITRGTPKDMQKEQQRLIDMLRPAKSKKKHARPRVIKG